MAKIAASVARAVTERLVAGAPGRVAAHRLARGRGWSVDDVVCTSGPTDRPYEERHTDVSISLVAAGTFQYRSGEGSELMTPGSLLLGNAGGVFECSHAHGTGDRCVAFHYQAEHFARLAADAGASPAERRFRIPRLPPLRALARVAAGASAALDATGAVAWEELSVALAAQAVQVSVGLPAQAGRTPAGAAARVSRVVRLIEHEPDARLSLGDLAREAGLSPYHFLRTFQRLTGVTPHQFILRVRLREAAVRLSAEPAGILDIALDCGFGDLSNFNRAFRAEFGVNPGAYRLQVRGAGSDRSGLS